MDKNTFIRHTTGLIGFALFFWIMAEMMNTAVQNMLDDLGVEKEMIDLDDFGG